MATSGTRIEKVTKREEEEEEEEKKEGYLDLETVTVGNRRRGLKRAKVIRYAGACSWSHRATNQCCEQIYS